jgi:hypothetical protein
VLRAVSSLLPGNPVLVSRATVTFTAPASDVSGIFAKGTDTAAALPSTSGVHGDITADGLGGP